MKLKWNKPAREALLKAILYIAAQSYEASIKVRNRVEVKTNGLLDHPAKYPPDRLMLRNDGTYRAFTSDSLRITYYRAFRTSIHITEVRHIKRKPLDY